MTQHEKWRVAPFIIALTVLLAVLMVAEPAAAQTDRSPGPNEVLQPRVPLRDPQHILFKRGVWSWKEIRDRNVVKQDRDYSCGAASLCTLLKYYWGDNVTEQMILDKLDKMLTPAEIKDRIKDGLSLTDLRRVSVKLGYLASIGTVSYEQLTQSKIPVLVALKIGKFNHFVVFRGADYYYVYLADPARGNIRTPIDEFLTQWQKNAILVVAKKDQDIRENSPLAVRPEESYQGAMNRVVIQKQLAAPVVFFPVVPH